MDPDVHRILLRNDVQGAWENPPGADWKEAVSRLKQRIPELELMLGTSLRLDEGVQDASLFADLGVLQHPATDNDVVSLQYLFCLRFSWFGGMFSVFGSNPETLDAAGAIQLLERFGYTYIPATELEALYDGVNEPYDSDLTWWVRYFDYL